MLGGGVLQEITFKRLK